MQLTIVFRTDSSGSVSIDNLIHRTTRPWANGAVDTRLGVIVAIGGTWAAPKLLLDCELEIKVCRRSENLP
jgi:hypothetical protein